jgi:hypothetical protein
MRKPTESNAKALFQRWHERDFLADTLCIHWQARLFYRALLQAAFLVTTRPDLPDDDDQLRRLLGGIPESTWEEHRVEVLGMFERAEVGGVKVLFQKRLRKDWASLEEYRDEQREKANTRWAKRRGEPSANSPVMPRHNNGNADAHATALHGQCNGNAKERVKERVRERVKREGEESVGKNSKATDLQTDLRSVVSGAEKPKVPEDVFKSAQKRFRRIVGRSLGSLSKKESEWSEIVAREGGETVLKAIEMWAQENKDFLKTAKFGCLQHFLKNHVDYIYAAKLPPEADDDDDDYGNAVTIEDIRPPGYTPPARTTGPR